MIYCHNLEQREMEILVCLVIFHKINHNYLSSDQDLKLGFEIFEENRGLERI